MKTKLRPTDTLFSRYMRRKFNFTCQYCGHVYLPDNAGGLDNAHFHGRNHENTRFDVENCLPLCAFRCHGYLDTHKTEFEAFMLERLGRRRYDLLALKAHTYKHRDDKADKIIIKDMLAKQELYVEV